MNRIEAAAIARAARKIPPLEERFWSKVDIREENECWPWKAAARNKKEGYGAFWYKGRHHPSARIAWFLTHGKLVEDLQVCHKCDNPSCCNPGHLFTGTNLDNNNDKVEKSRHVYGEKHTSSVLSEENVVEIISLKPRKRSAYGHRKQLAEKYGVGVGCISDIWMGKSWRHIKR